VKPEVNCRRPTKFTHIRPKNYKEEFFRKREHAIENNILVAKILNAKSNYQITTPPPEFAEGPGGTSQMKETHSRPQSEIKSRLSRAAIGGTLLAAS
jgi:hypothetical protein